VHEPTPDNRDRRERIDGGFTRALTRGVGWNLAGLVLPLPAGLIAFPLMASALGEFRFGLLTVVWAVVGYFSLFDFGVARALTRELSIGIRDGAAAGESDWVRTAAVLSLTFGVAGAALLSLASPLLVQALGNGDNAAQRWEILLTIVATSALLPVFLLICVLQGILEAMQRFRDLALLRLPLTLATYLVPVAVLPFEPNVPTIVCCLVATRLVIVAAFWFGGARRTLAGTGGGAFSMQRAKTLLVQGGWMTVTNVISPVLTYLDRWLVVALISVAALGYYSVPLEVGQRLLVVAVAVAGVLFPMFAREGSHSQRSAAGYRHSSAAVAFSVMPIVLVVGGWAEELLSLWMGQTFAQQAAVALQIIMPGILLNSIARIPFTLLQAAGRARTTASLHLLELPVYVGVAWWLIANFGLLGAAAAWTVRVLADLALMLAAAARLSPELRQASLRTGLLVVAALSCYGGVLAIEPQAGRILAAMSALALIGLLAWKYLLNATDRGTVRHLLQSLASQRARDEHPVRSK
jgi:O-antigen/teichoic acid export membrane protein